MSLKNTLIRLTVALPLWNSKEIAWLAMEGLCNQKGIDFDWELIICEENIGKYFGVEEVKKYIERLKKVGCARIQYIPLNYRISLPEKWCKISENISDTSFVFLLHASDCYSYETRLKDTYEKAAQGFDWIHNERGYFYSIHRKNMIEYDGRTYKYKTGLNMAVSTSLLHKLKRDVKLERGIDRWFYECVQPTNVYWFKDEIITGVDTDGYNNISMSRRDNFLKVKPPFVATDKKLGELIPEYIIKKLEALC